MPRFFAEITHPPQAVIRGKAAHHITGPLRKKEGDEIHIRDGARGHLARITSIRSGEIVLEILCHEDLSDRCSAHLHLAMCLVDFRDMEEAIRYATELGVAEIRPVIAGRSNIRSVSEARFERWQAIVTEAVKQCERKTLPHLCRPEPLEAFIREVCRLWGERLVALKGAERSISDHRQPDEGILIGPEGGFTPDEQAMILQEGFMPVSLGDTTLRAVTAAIAALSILGA